VGKVPAPKNAIASVTPTRLVSKSLPADAAARTHTMTFHITNGKYVIQDQSTPHHNWCRESLYLEAFAFIQNYVTAP
jgi:hypothetical protein